MNKENLLQMYTAEQLAYMYLQVTDNYDNYIKNTGAIMDDLKARIDELESKLAERNKAEKTESVLFGSFYSPKGFIKSVDGILSIDTSKIQDDVHRFNIEFLQRLARYEKGEAGLNIEKDSGATDLEFYKRRVKELEAKYQKQHEHIANLKEENGRWKVHADIWKNCILPTATKEAYDIINEKQPLEIKIVSRKEWDEKIIEAKRGESAIEQIDSILAELFGIAHNGYEYSGEFKQLLKQKTQYCVPIQQNPVDIASDMIKVFRCEIGELRQIAEHLLVYCNHNEG